jgi:hypothetical protein
MPKIKRNLVLMLAPLLSVAMVLVFRITPGYPRPISLFFQEVKTPPTWKETFIPINGADLKLSKADIDVSCPLGPVEIVEVIQRAVSNRKFDIVFLLDNSGSMMGHADGIRKSLNTVCDKFDKSGADIRLAGVHFGNSEDVCFPTDSENFKEFREWLDGTGTPIPNGAVLESRFKNVDAISAIPARAFREDAQMVFITIGDDDNHLGNTGGARSAVELNRAFPKAMWFSITTKDNHARKVSNDLKGIHIPLPTDGTLNLNRINFSDLVVSKTVAKIRYRLPNGRQTLTVSSNAGSFPSQPVKIDVQ